MHAFWTKARGGAGLAVSLLTGVRPISGYTLDLDSLGSVKVVASSIAQDMMTFYNGDQPGGIPGLLPQPYYWWEAGALMGSLIDYWYYTGDTQWLNVTTDGLLFQSGPNNDYMPPNQTMTEGNDDQGFWGLAVMSAAEYNFQNPPEGQPQWLALAQAVFNTQAARWDEQECGGGLRWQIFTWNNGFDYKNAISQACFFNLAARLARYTGNQSYADWADKTWDWMESAKLLSPDTYYIYDGTHTANCSEITPYQWTYNAGAFLLGAAAMYNYSTGSTRELWRFRLDGLLNGTMAFFTGNNSDIMTEVACEPVDLCDLDQQSFKAYLSRWMAATVKWAPWTASRIMPLLRSSAMAAVATCTGGDNGRMCGLKWTEAGKWDGTTGVGQQMAVMELVLGNMIHVAPEPVTVSTGGTSAGNPGAGGDDVGRTDPFTILELWPPPTTADRVGAYIITVAMVLGMVCGCIFVVVDENSKQTTIQTLWGRVKPGDGRNARQPQERNVNTTIMNCPQSESDAIIARLGNTMLDDGENEDKLIKTHHTAVVSPEGTPTSRTTTTLSHHRAARSEASGYWERTNNRDESFGGARSTHRTSSPASSSSNMNTRENNTLSYPRVNRRRGSLRKKAILQNTNRMVHWRDTNQDA
ncbi:glycosyl hydrolase family 76-domain-containing protein [Apodospora peruviana]|uniref:mannan endo-1,6-alpha-mannosidase n=1 Tax=Apodospora peruviana TaxID=516989 RepID=A0AAE0ITT3_9PEZI|nr:glycosyl hydrolase family 76-domain-containing protein [Apodospora peruviana]